MLLHHSPSPPRHALKCRVILAEDFICPHDGHYAHLGGATLALGSCGYTSLRTSSLTSPCPPVHALLCLGMLLLEISFQHFSKLLIPYVASLWPCHTFLWLIKVFSAICTGIPSPPPCASSWTSSTSLRLTYLPPVLYLAHQIILGLLSHGVPLYLLISHGFLHFFHKSPGVRSILFLSPLPSTSSYLWPKCPSLSSPLLLPSLILSNILQFSVFFSSSFRWFPAPPSIRVSPPSSLYFPPFSSRGPSVPKLSFRFPSNSLDV